MTKYYLITDKGIELATLSDDVVFDPYLQDGGYRVTYPDGSGWDCRDYVRLDGSADDLRDFLNRNLERRIG